MNDKHPRNLHEAALDLYEACKEFVAKVESNQARSGRSYMRMKAAIAKADGAEGQGTWTGEMCAHA
jgi:hypothetical protein